MRLQTLIFNLSDLHRNENNEILSAFEKLNCSAEEKATLQLIIQDAESDDIKLLYALIKNNKNFLSSILSRT